MPPVADSLCHRERERRYVCLLRGYVCVCVRTCLYILLVSICNISYFVSPTRNARHKAKQNKAPRKKKKKKNPLTKLRKNWEKRGKQDAATDTDANRRRRQRHKNQTRLRVSACVTVNNLINNMGTFERTLFASFLCGRFLFLHRTELLKCAAQTDKLNGMAGDARLSCNSRELAEYMWQRLLHIKLNVFGLVAPPNRYAAASMI